MTDSMEFSPDPTPYVSAPPKRKPRWIATAAVSAVAVAAGAFGVVVLAAGDGADSPEAAVDAFFDAIDHEDVIGVMEALDPEERQILRPAVEDTGNQAKRVKVASENLDLRHVAGVELQVEGLAYSTEPMAVGLVAVDLTGGRVNTSTDINKFPVGSTISDILENDNREAGKTVDRQSSDSIDLNGVRLVAVQRGGQWHVSALYSIAEQVRRDGDPVLALPDFGHGIAAKGAADPESAVRDAIAAATTLDVRRLIELSPPGEMAVLHDYGPLLVEASADSAHDAGDKSSGFEVSDLKLKVTDGPAGTKVVSATSFKLTNNTEYDRNEIVFDGTCTTFTYTSTYPDDGQSQNNGEIWAPGPQKICKGDAQLNPLGFGLLNPMFSGGELLRVVTEQHDGQWFISPTRSVIESTLGNLRDLTPEDVKRTVRWWAGDYWISEPDAMWKACGIEKPSIDATSAHGEKAAQDCYDNLPSSYEGPFGPFGPFGPLSSSTDFGDGSSGSSGNIGELAPPRTTSTTVPG